MLGIRLRDWVAYDEQRARDKHNVNSLVWAWRANLRDVHGWELLLAYPKSEKGL